MVGKEGGGGGEGARKTGRKKLVGLPVRSSRVNSSDDGWPRDGFALRTARA